METSGSAPFEVLNEAASHLDTLIFDLKIMDTQKHLEFTGGDLKLILQNLTMIYSEYQDLSITVRTPVVPGFNQDLDAAEAIGQFLRKMPRVSYEALAYHSLGRQKYSYLGRQYTMAQTSLSENELTKFSLAVEQARSSVLFI
jgi:pyruvate formate lyase activating enzyme